MEAFVGLFGDLPLLCPLGCTALGDFGNLGVETRGDGGTGRIVARSFFFTDGDLDRDFMDRKDCGRGGSGDGGGPGDSDRSVMDRIELGRVGAVSAAGEERCLLGLDFPTDNLDADALL